MRASAQISRHADSLLNSHLNSRLKRLSATAAWRWYKIDPDLRVLAAFYVCAIAFAMSACPAHADRTAAAAIGTTAQAHLDKGLELYQKGDLFAAEQELLLGQEIEASPVFLYALGQVERTLGRCYKAIEYYRAYLPSATPKQRAATQIQINRCEQSLLERGLPLRAPESANPPDQAVPSAPVAPAKEVPAAPSNLVSADPTHRARAWYRDPAGLSLLSTGAAVAIGGGVLVGIGNPSNVRSSYGAFDDAYSRRWQSPVGVALLSVGGALVLGGAIRLGLQARKHQHELGSAAQVATRAAR